MSCLPPSCSRAPQPEAKQRNKRDSALTSGTAVEDKDHRSTTAETRREVDNIGLDSQKERDSGGTHTTTESEREKACDVSSSCSVKKCGSLVEFVLCYGPLLDSVRLKQLLSSKQWGERRDCLMALSQARSSETEG